MAGSPTEKQIQISETQEKQEISQNENQSFDYSKTQNRIEDVKNEETEENIQDLKTSLKEIWFNDDELKWIEEKVRQLEPKSKVKVLNELVASTTDIDKEEFLVLFEETMKKWVKSEKKQATAETRDEEKENENKSVKNLELFNQLDGLTQWLDENNENYWDVIKNIRKIKTIQDVNEANKILQETLGLLKQKPEVLGAILQDLPEENRKSFEQTLIKLDPEFASILPTLPYRNQILLWTNSTENIQISHWKLTQTKDNFQTTATLDGKTRSLKLVNWKYEITNPWSENKLQTVDNVQTKLTEKIKPLQEKLNTISSLLKYIDEAITQNTDLQDVKNNIKQFNEKLYNELWLEQTYSLQEIKTKLDWIYKKTEEEKEEYIKEE